MGLAMMAPAQRHGELITNLAAQRAVLGEAQMVGVGRPAPTNQASLFTHELDMLLVTKAAWLRMGLLSMPSAAAAPARLRGCCASLEGDLRGTERVGGDGWPLPSSSVASFGLESIFDLPRVDFSQAVLGAKDPVCPDGGVIRRGDYLELVQKLLAQRG
jgi:hypothetical protein